VALWCAHPQDVLCVRGSVHFTRFTLTYGGLSNSHDLQALIVTPEQALFTLFQ
jgi:hypothetical protein